MKGLICRGGILVLFLFAAGCGSSLKISSDYDPNMVETFPTYKTYAWLEKEGDFVVDGVQAYDDIVAGRIRTAVNEQLALKGYQLATSADPNFLVGYHVALRGKMDVSTVNSYYGYGPGSWYGPAYGYGSGYSETYVREYTEGTLVIDFIDTGKGELAWRGTAQAEVTQTQDPAKRQERINKAVAEILQRFPPPAK